MHPTCPSYSQKWGERAPPEYMAPAPKQHYTSEVTHYVMLVTHSSSVIDDKNDGKLSVSAAVFFVGSWSLLM